MSCVYSIVLLMRARQVLPVTSCAVLVAMASRTGVNSSTWGFERRQKHAILALAVLKRDLGEPLAKKKRANDFFQVVIGKKKEGWGKRTKKEALSSPSRPSNPSPPRS